LNFWKLKFCLILIPGANYSTFSIQFLSILTVSLEGVNVYFTSCFIVLDAFLVGAVNLLLTLIVGVYTLITGFEARVKVLAVFNVCPKAGLLTVDASSYGLISLPIFCVALTVVANFLSFFGFISLSTLFARSRHKMNYAACM